MRELCGIIRDQVEASFANLEVMLMTYDRDELVCGIPAWRYARHIINSADKGFTDPDGHTEPPFRFNAMENRGGKVPDDDELLDYLGSVRQKTYDYIDSLTDDMLYEKAGDSPFTRMELILRQLRHIAMHIGMINALTVIRTDRFPMYYDSGKCRDINNRLFS